MPHKPIDIPNPSKIILIEEKSILSNFNANINTVVITNKIQAIAVFGIFLKSFSAADIIKTATAACIPINAFLIHSILINFSKNNDITKIMTKDGITRNKVESKRSEERRVGKEC